MPQDDISQRTTKTQSSSSGYPDINPHEEKILIIVKTYPHPSVSYKEVVCTAGVTETGKWIRLYPIDYRYLQYAQWYKKYQWIRAKIEKNQNDFRIDSYRPVVDSIQIIGKSLDTKKDKQWLERKKIVLPTIHYKSLHQIQDDYEKEGMSLGIFKPKRIIDFLSEADTTDWSKRHQQVLSQQVLFGKQPKPLTKIPYKFSYKFVCDDIRCKGHKLAIFDWEIFMLYLNIKTRYNYAMDVILQKIKDKWLTDMWSPKRDSYLIVGTQYPNPTFIILGVFRPPK